jgi:hypothetical protein
VLRSPLSRNPVWPSASDNDVGTKDRLISQLNTRVRCAAGPPASAPPPWPDIRRFIDEHHAQRLVGWHDAPHFTRLFRRRCGVSPRSLRS